MLLNSGEVYKIRPVGSSHKLAKDMITWADCNDSQATKQAEMTAKQPNKLKRQKKHSQEAPSTEIINYGFVCRSLRLIGHGPTVIVFPVITSF